MNEKEVAELRRRLRPDRNGITHIRGCYVNENREIVSQFDQSLALMTQEEGEKFLSLLRRTLSGGLGKNLTDLSFSTRQVVEGEAHKLLISLRNTALKDDQRVQDFFQRAIAALDLEGNYLVLLAHDSYDVPYRSEDGARQDDASSEVFSYILCSVCPVKPTPPALSYYVRENEFHTRPADWIVAPPELGFLFPAFDDRSANLYGALYYSRNLAENHGAFVDAVFQSGAPMPPAAQKESFGALLGDTLAEACSFDVVQSVHEQLCELIEEHKERKEDEPLALSKGAVKCVLKSCGVADSHVAAFDARFDDEFGPDAALSPRNLVDPKQMEVSTPDVTIRVSAGRGDLVQTRVIDGVKYILIRADDGVEVNGVGVHIT